MLGCSTLSAGIFQISLQQTGKGAGGFERQNHENEGFTSSEAMIPNVISASGSHHCSPAQFATRGNTALCTGCSRSI